MILSLEQITDITRGVVRVEEADGYLRLCRIGGDKYHPEIIELDSGIFPDIVTVAYGSNDWQKLTKDEFSARCRAFCEQVSSMYPSSKIFVISPIWRIDARKTYNFDDTLEKMHDVIEECGRDIDNIIAIKAYNFVPHMKEFFKDMRLHPNDLGSVLYAQSLYSEIIKHI